MMLTLLWKEFREHWSIWLTMVVMTGLFGLGIAHIPDTRDTTGNAGMAILAMAAVYGVVCGSMMFAGEREGGTLVFLDIFLGRRDLLWLGKFFIGVLLVVTQALAVALTFYLANQLPPTWMPAVIGQRGGEFVELLPGARPPTPRIWFLVVPLVTLEGYAWGLLASTMTHRVLTSAGLALVIGFPVWWFTVLIPAPASLVLRVLLLTGLFAGSFWKFLAQARDTASAPPPMFLDPKTIVLRELERELELGRRQPTPGRTRHEGWGEPLPVTLAPQQGYTRDADDRPRRQRRHERPVQAMSPREVLLWLTFGQAGLPLAVLAAASALVGFFVPAAGQVLWPVATLLLGVACGTAAFAFEQSDLSYQFLAAQHFPLKTIWNVKIIFWGVAAVLMVLLLSAAGGLLILLASADARNAELPTRFRFGTLLELMGPTLFFAVWLVYGFCVGQVFVLLCRKPIYAVMISTMVALGAIGLWLPSLLCRGMGGWQLWVTPIALLVATRILVRAWAAGRIKERRPMAALVGVGMAAFVWLVVQMSWRAWEVPGVAEPLDRVAFRATIPTGEANSAGQKIQEAIAEFEATDGKEAVWLARMTEVVQLPLGVIETPSSEGNTPLMRHLPACRRMTEKLLTKARNEMAQGKLDSALEHLTQILALSRNLRNKAPIGSYATGVGVEESALLGLDELLQRTKPPPQLLRQILATLDRHAAETPPALDCLQTECYRAGGLLERPTGWAFYTGGIPERTLAGGIALSLETPWERERATRIWRLVWAGYFRAVETPHWQLPEGNLAAWLPATKGSDASISQYRLERLLQASWLGDSQLYCDVLHLQAAANRARWQVDANRLAVALLSYQVREGKPAQKLDDLVPKDLPALPMDPYSGKSFLYRIEKENNLVFLEHTVGVQGLRELGRSFDRGDGILWSTGPDRVDDGGRRHGGRLHFHSVEWTRPGFDLLTRVPRGR